MTTPDRRGIVDKARSASLADVGGAAGYEAATVIDHEGNAHLALILRSAVGNLASVYDPGCTDVEHERDDGPLPLDIMRRIAIARPTAPPDERNELEP